LVDVRYAGVYLMRASALASQNNRRKYGLEIRLPSRGYAKTMFFNRLRVEHDEGFCVISFGLVSRVGLLLDSYSCVLPRFTLDQNQKPLLDYLEQIGFPKEPPAPGWQGTPPQQVLPVVDVINMAIRGEMAETCFWVFSFHGASRHRRTSSEDVLEAQPLALLRSQVETQKQLIRALYER